MKAQLNAFGCIKYIEVPSNYLPIIRIAYIKDLDAPIYVEGTQALPTSFSIRPKEVEFKLTNQWDHEGNPIYKFNAILR